MLLLASLSVMSALVLVVVLGPAAALQGWRTTFILLLSVAAGGTVLAAAMAFATMVRSGGQGRHSHEEIAELRKNLLTAESIIKAEPQVLVFWEEARACA